MRSPLLKLRIIGALLLAVALSVSGCTALRTAYQQGPTLAYWYLDGFADWQADQAPHVREAIAAWFRWHRQAQLPTIGDVLARTRDAVGADVDADTVCAWGQDVQALASPAFEQALPALVDLAHRLTPAQVTHIERKYASVNEKFAKTHLQPDPNERLEAQLDRVVTRAERLYKRLTPAQKTLLRESLRASPADAQAWLAERARRQQAVIHTLRAIHEQPTPRQQTAAAFRQLFAQWQQPPGETARQANARWMRFNCELAAQLHNSTSEAQREAARATLGRWQADVAALSAHRPRHEH